MSLISFLYAVACLGLVGVLSTCLKYFNALCSQDLLKTGKGSYTATVLGNPEN